ncbi:hypothetical protein D7X74_24480 [Corallococcus sp. CA047B]|uniref:GIY-YIG nuclease family protein n=1 Tax=Corallococcus sp. CA047B TaxID=2316729 RepID=UPI000EA148CF|nr:GIY-YIG nuclease family protein [Corallococcus sp. CA047B]RKH11980.1 hypothetical protein D7X74_24480 [Corallococcus sp. CA047B]
MACEFDVASKVQQLRAEVARERELRIRIEARRDGTRAAYERIMALLTGQRGPPPARRVAAPPGDSRSGWVYFIQQGKYGPIKIGWSRAPATRLVSLQTANPAPLTLLATVPGSRMTELQLHEQFAAYRMTGEWFRPVPALICCVRAVVAEFGRPTP